MFVTAPSPPHSDQGTKVPNRAEWIHEVKHDGYRLIVQRDGDRVRLFTRNGHDWSYRYPFISEAALRIRNTSFVLDGEAVLLGVDSGSDFNGLHSRKHDAEVQLYAFDMMAGGGDDIRQLPLTLRKANLPRLLARRVDGIHLRLRDRRNRPRPLPARLPDGARGSGLEAPRPRLPRWPVQSLEEGQEPEAPGHEPRRGPGPSEVKCWTHELGVTREQLQKLVWKCSRRRQEGAGA